MTTYYVSPSGSDANNGLGPDASHSTNKPWLTIGKALGASGIASGDTVYLAPGTYREVVSVGMTSAIAETSIIGDPGNAQGFKTAAGVRLASGEVVWTAYTTNDTTTPSTTVTVNLNGRDFLTFRYLTIVGASAASESCVKGTTAHSTNITFLDCKFINSHINASAITYTSIADTAANWTFDRCVFLSHSGAVITITLATSAIADYDAAFLIQNSLLLVPGTSAIGITASGASAFKGGGIDILNCTVVTRSAAVVTTSANISTSIPCTCYNSLLICSAGAALSANTSGQIVEDYCRIVSQTPRTNVSAGAASIADFTHALLLDLGWAAQIGAMQRPFFSPSTGSPILGFGSTGAPSVDLLNRPRPAGGASTNNAVGALERHDTATQELTTVRTGSSALVLVGPGDHDFELPVDAVATTVTVYGRYDASHAATNKPQMIVTNGGECGVNDASATMTAAADTWEQLSLAFTPTRAGIVTIRLISRSAAGGGKAFFDDVAVTV